MSEIIDDGQYGTGTTHRDASVWPTATTWGLISAAVGFVLLLIQYNTGAFDIDPDTGQVGSNVLGTLISVALSVAFIYLGLKAYRDKANGGELSLGRGVLWSLAFGVIGGLVTALLMYVFYAFIAPEVIQNMALAQEVMMEEQGMSDQEIETAAEMSGMFMSPVVFAGSTLIGSVIASVIIGLIVSLVVKTR